MTDTPKKESEENSQNINKSEAEPELKKMHLLKDFWKQGDTLAEHNGSAIKFNQIIFFIGIISIFTLIPQLTSKQSQDFIIKIFHGYDKNKYVEITEEKEKKTNMNIH